MLHRFLPRWCHREKSRVWLAFQINLGYYCCPPKAHESTWHFVKVCDTSLNQTPLFFSTRPGELILIYELSRLITFPYFYTHILFLFALDIVLMEWQQWGRTSPCFAVGRVHLEFSKLWKPVEEFKTILWREDQQLQKHPGGLSINREDCGQLHTLCLPGWNCYTHLWPIYKPNLFHCLTELECVSYSSLMSNETFLVRLCFIRP